MKNFEVYYPLGELDSFVDQLQNHFFNKFEFSIGPNRNGDYVLFSFIKEDESEKVFELIKVIDEIPLPFIANPYIDKAIFTVLCFVLKNKLIEVEIYGQCNLEMASVNNELIVVRAKADESSSQPFIPDLNSLNEFFKSRKNNNGKIRLNVPLVSCQASTINYKWSLRALLRRFNFINVKQI